MLSRLASRASSKFVPSTLGWTNRAAQFSTSKLIKASDVTAVPPPPTGDVPAAVLERVAEAHPDLVNRVVEEWGKASAADQDLILKSLGDWKQLTIEEKQKLYDHCYSKSFYEEEYERSETGWAFHGQGTAYYWLNMLATGGYWYFFAWWFEQEFWWGGGVYWHRSSKDEWEEYTEARYARFDPDPITRLGIENGHKKTIEWGCR